MISAETIREHLIARLEPIFGKTRNADGLADTLASKVPEHARPEQLEGIADRMIETRKAKGFPAASELIQAIKAIAPPGSEGRKGGGYNPNAEMEKRREEDEAERRALRLLAGTELAKRAVDERWAPCLLEFVTAKGYIPDLLEERELIATCRRNDRMVREDPGVMGANLVAMREFMHVKASRLLGFPVNAPATIVSQPRRPTGPDPERLPEDLDLTPSSGLLRTLGAEPDKVAP